MIIDRSKHNKFVGLPEKTTDTRGTTSASGSGSGDRSTTVIIGGGGGTASLDPELIEELRNQEAFSYLNVSDGVNTETAAAKIEKDYINLNFIGDGETSETQVSSGRYLPETYLEATGAKPGNYNLSYEQIKIPEVVDGEAVETVKWRITLKKVFGDPIFPNTDFNGIELLKDDASLGVYKLTDERVTVSSDDSTGLIQIVIMQDEDIDFDKLQFVNQIEAKNEIVTVISEIGIQTYITILITQAGATRFWKLDENNKLYTEYDAYSNKTLGAKDLIWTDKGYTVGDFVQGISGGVFYIADELGTTYIETDKLRVRKKAYFETLEIVNVNTVGGKQIISPGGAITIRKVEEFDDYYRCYFLGKQDDVVVENRFKVDDLAFSQNFNIKEPGEYEQVANHYFWRLVVGVSTDVDADDNHYIDLSKTDCDLDSDIPHVNDVVAQLGNKTDTDRQSALIFSSVDVESPRIILCNGISTYTLTATDRFDLGVNHTNNQAYMNVYGNAYIGAKDQSSYMNYSIENGLSIKGNLDVSSTIGGKSFSDVFITSENFEETVNAVVGDELEYLQNQIDGNIESYFYDYSPTIENYPASEWTDEQIKTRHIGDTFTNIQEYVDDETTPDAGKSWRWVKSAEGVWGWTPIADSDAVLALKRAGQAQDTADGKRRVFVQQPTDMDEYDVGDLWVNASYSDSNVTYTDDLLRAKNSKAKGHPFDINHWALASNYKNLAEDAIAAAEAAGEAANNAQQSIDNYKDEINNVFQDGVITTSEASRLRTLVDTVNTTLYDVQKTYNDIYNNGSLDNKPQKEQLETAYSTFDTAADNLIQIVTEIVDKATTQSYTITKADITNVDNAYSIFNTKYADYVIALNAANLEIMNTLSNTAYANAVNAFGWLNGLFDPDQKTTIEGAVVTTGILALGKTLDGVFTVNAGINGVENDSYLGNGIAIWFGGDMIDKDNYSAGQRPVNTASSLFRFDGSGYLGYKPNSDASNDEAPIWWDTQGNLHANPLSFFVGEETVGFLLSAFQPVDSNQDGIADYIIQHVPFQTVQIGSAYLGYDAVNKAVYVYTKEADGSNNICNFYATGEVTAYGSSDGADMPKIINYLYELKDVNWGIGTAPADADTMIMWNGETWLYVNKNDVGLNEAQLEQYLTENEYAKKSDLITNVSWSAITGKPTTLAGYGITDAVIIKDGYPGSTTDPDANYPAVGYWANVGSYFSMVRRGQGGQLRISGGELSVRGCNNSVFGDWTKVITESNYTSTLDTRYVKKSGDTMTGTLTISNSNFGKQLIIYREANTGTPSIAYKNNTEILGYIGVGSSAEGENYLNPVFVDKSENVYRIWHAGNGGSGSGLDADLLDGVHNGDLVALTIRGVYTGAGGMQPPSYFKDKGISVNMMNIPIQYSDVVYINGYDNGGYDVPYINAIAFQKANMEHTNVYHASAMWNGSSWNIWHTFIDSYNIKDYNAGSATKLQTPRTIWGQSFDGTNKVSGQLSGCTRVMNASNQPIYLGNADNSGWVYTQDIVSHQGTGYWIINHAGNSWFRKVNIGYSYPNEGSFPLNVQGTISSTSLSTQNIRIECDNNGVLEGRGSEINNYNSSLYLQYSSSTNLICCVGGGNMGVGTPSPAYKLHVEGNIYTPNYVIADAVYTRNWFRSEGDTGWFSETYRGGIYMEDTTWVRIYNKKSLYVTGTIMADGFNAHGNNYGYIVINKLGSNYAAIGGNGAINEIKFGKSDINGAWISETLNWRFEGNIVATGEVTAYGSASDMRLKQITETEYDALSIIDGLSTFKYKWNDLAKDVDDSDIFQDDYEHYGLSAQELQKVSESFISKTKVSDKYLILKKEELVPLLVAAIKQLSKKIKNLENK